MCINDCKISDYAVLPGIIDFFFMQFQNQQKWYIEAYFNQKPDFIFKIRLYIYVNNIKTLITNKDIRSKKIKQSAKKSQPYT